MSTVIERTAAVIGSPKLAALYYDKIFPLPGQSVHIEEVDSLLRQPRRDVENLLTEDAQSCEEILNTLKGMLIQPEHKIRSRITRFGDPYFRDVGDQAMYFASCECNLVGTMELVLSELPQANNNSKDLDRSSSALLKMINLKLVDPSNAPWEQIFEFRRDIDAMQALARLRDYLFTSCKDMAPVELQDRLSTIVHDYEIKRKKHGISAREASIEVLLNSESSLRAACSGALGYAFGHTAASAAVLAGTTLVFDAAKACIASKRELSDRDAELKQHPANWVFLARDALGDLDTNYLPKDRITLLGHLFRMFRR
jgi:hypothetical protein